MELNQEHLINVDYNLNMNINIVDRDIFLAKPPTFDGPRKEDPYKKLGKN